MERRIIIIELFYLTILVCPGSFDLTESNSPNECRYILCPKTSECPPDSYRHPGLVDSSQVEVCCPSHRQDCLCNPGLICPSPPLCPDGLLTSTVTSQTGKPGQCCPIYECVPELGNGTTEIGMERLVCLFSGERYDSGQSWIHQEGCTECDCHHGVVSCQPIHCDVYPECAVVRPLPGSCCPVCIGCMTNFGKVYNNSDVWDEDPCTTCECSEGRIKCHAVMCQTTCLNPVHIHGECCPRCDDKTGCPFMKCELECPNGFRLTHTGCPTCECIPCRSVAECTELCEFGFETNEEGCPVCLCHQGKVGIHVHHQIQERSRPGKDFTILSQSQSLATSCDTTTLDGTSHPDGEEWLENCRRCVCKNGSEMCSLISCSPPKCEHPVLYPGSCCPMCPGQFVEQHYFEDDVSSVCHGSSDGIQHIEGDMWKLGRCLTCTCDNGQILCAAPECLPTPCAQALIESEGDCCMKCPNNTSIVLSDKNTFTNSSDHSQLNCFSDDSQKVYGSGEMWKVGACQSCICHDGQVLCFSGGTCPTLECERPVLAKNQCCPICLGEAMREISSVPTTRTRADQFDQSSTIARRIIATEFGSKSPQTTSKEEINYGKSENSWSLEANHVIVISVFLCVSLLLVVFIIRIYYYRRQIRLDKQISFHSSNSSTTSPPITPECLYKYENSTQLSEQKTPLCHNSYKSNDPRNTTLILNTDKV